MNYGYAWAELQLAAAECHYAATARSNHNARICLVPPVARRRVHVEAFFGAQIIFQLLWYGCTRHNGDLPMLFVSQLVRQLSV